MAGLFTVLLYAPVFSFLWQAKHTVDSFELSAPEEVTGAPRGSVTVSCRYDQRFRKRTKYWCKGPVYELCSIVVKTPKQRPNNRSFIVDDTEAGVFNVTITSLRDSDENMYWCVIARPGRNIYTGVRLIVSHAVTTTATMIQATSLLIPEQAEVRWWATLRWILFVFMLCCLLLTQAAVWMKTTRRMTRSHKSNEQIQLQNSNIYG